jgi:hypothetical protein
VDPPDVDPPDVDPPDVDPPDDPPVAPPEAAATPHTLVEYGLIAPLALYARTAKQYVCPPVRSSVRYVVTIPMSRVVVYVPADGPYPTTYPFVDVSVGASH